MSFDRKKATKMLGELLVEYDLVTPEQLQMALDDQKKSGGLVGEILVGWGYTTEEAITQVLASQYDIPYIQPSLYEASDEVIRLIPKEFASRHSVVGLDKFGSVLTVAMSNPLNHEAIEKLQEMTQCSVRTFITTYSEIMRSIERHYEFQKPGSL